MFKDITPLLADKAALTAAVERMTVPWAGERIDRVVGIESRGFIFAAPIAMALDAGFVPVRKPGKLPAATESLTYDLEYGTDTLEVHTDGVSADDRVLIVDDVLATGGTAAATIELVEALGAIVVGASFLVELSFLNGAGRLPDVRYTVEITY